MSGETMVQIALDDLCSLKSTADVAQIYKKERDDVQLRLNKVCKDEADLRAVAEDVKERYTKLTDEATIQAAEINQLRQRLIKTEQEQAWWTAAENATKPEKDAHAFLAAHDTPFEANETYNACKIIRALLAQAHTKTPEVTA